MRALYNYVIAPALLVGYRLAALFSDKAGRFFSMRVGMFERLEKELTKLDREGRELILFHVASVGELLEAMPVMRALSEQTPAPLIVLSYTSPSLHGHLPRDLVADLVTPSPLDFPGRTRVFMDAVRPDLVVFSSYDLWPNMVFAAADRGIPVALVNGRLPAVSGRYRWPWRKFFATVYGQALAVGAIDEDSAARFGKLGVGEDRISVTGNCRFDQTLARARAVSDDDPGLGRLPRFDFAVVAGSTWPEDHARILGPLAELLREKPDAGLIIAPHEPSPEHVGEIEAAFMKAGLKTARYTGMGASADESVRVVIVDTVGVLYKLYRRGHLAYIGGSFRQGVHNVMEPAAMGLPVLFGPRHKNSPEAEALAAAGGARVVRDQGEARSALFEWYDRRDALARASRAAREFIESSAGATPKTLSLLAATRNKRA